jgi:iron complex transport system ATP-binding protein
MSAEKPPLLDFRNIRVMRGEKAALDDFSLRIGAEEHVAILGPNGCGKSTLIKTITRECYPVVRAGSSMSILGKETWDVFELRARLGIVSNDLMLSPEMHAGEMLSCRGFSAASAFFRITRSIPDNSSWPMRRLPS